MWGYCGKIADIVLIPPSIHLCLLLQILAEETFLDLAVYTLLQTLKSLQGEVLSDKQVLDAIQTWVDHCGEDRQQSAPLVRPCSWEWG